MTALIKRTSGSEFNETKPQPFIVISRYKYGMSRSHLKWQPAPDTTVFLTLLSSEPTVGRAVVSRVCVCLPPSVWEGLCPWENEFRWKQTSESVSRQPFKSLLSANDDEHCVDEAVD